MRLHEVARENAGDLPGLVEGDVDEETRAGAARDVPHFLPNRVADGHAEGRPPVADVGVAVVAHHGFERRHPGHDPLGPPAKPGEEMGLDEPGDNAHIGLREVPVDQGRGTAPGGAELEMRPVVLGFVVDTAVSLNHLRREHRLELLARVGPVRAEGVEKGDVLTARPRRLKIREQPRQEPFVGGGARDVGVDNRDPGIRPDLVAQRERGDGRVESREEARAFIGQPALAGWLDERGERIGELHREMPPAVGKFNAHIRRATR